MNIKSSLLGLTIGLFAWQIIPAPAATIVMDGSDPLGSTSFNTGLNWTGGAVPTSGNAYQTSSFLLRTPVGATSIAFAGDSLEVQNGGILRDKTAATVTVTNLILDDGSAVDLTQPNNINNNTAAGTLAGGITVSGTAALHAGIGSDVAGETFTISAIIGGTGGISTAGSTGNLIFTATNVYSGGTTVAAGSLLVNGVLANSAVTITGGTLGGNGIINAAVTNQAGGLLQPGLGGTDTSTLTISNNLVLAGTTVMTLNRGNAQKAAKIAGLTTLTQGGTLTVTNAGGAPQLGDSFQLFSAASYAGSFSAVNLPALTSGLSWNTSLSANGSISVVATPAGGTGVWTNDASGNWSTAANWLNGLIANGNGSNANFSTINLTTDRTVTLDTSRNIGNLQFGDTVGSQNWFLNASGGSVLTLAVASGSPTVTVTNNTATLSLPLAGTAGLTKAGTGTLVLSGNNTYSGATIVNSGTMSFSGAAGGTAAATTLTVGNVANTPAVLNILPGANVTEYTLTIGNNATAPGAIFQSGGTLTQTDGGNVVDFQLGGVTGAYGYYQLSGGILNANEVGVGGYAGFTSSTGVMDITGGTFYDAGWITMGRGQTTSSGVLNVSGTGSIQLAGLVGGSRISFNWGGNPGLAVINVFNGGSIIGPASTTYVLDLATANTAGTLNVMNLNSGGLLAIGAVAPVSASPISLLNFNGGSLKATLANPAFLTSPNLTGAYVYPGGATIDDGGFAITVAEPLLAPVGYGVSSIPVANGGSGFIGAPMVSITGGSGVGATAIAQLNFTTGAITNILVTSPGAGYASGDAGSISVTLTGGGGSGALLGTVSLAANGSGGLTKAGAGTLTVSGANTYTGRTTVGNGILLLNGSLAGGAVVSNGGTLSGNGSISGAVTNQAGGTLEPGLGGTDTSMLAVNNNLVLAGATVLAVNRSNSPNASGITGITTLQQGGTLNVTNVGGQLQADDTFTLFNAATRTGTFSAINLPSLASGLVWTNLLSVNGTIAVVSTLPPGVPLVANLPANFVLATSAHLNGQVLATGGQIPNVTIYYGTTDGGTNAGAWANSVSLGVETGTFSASISGLATNTTYYFTAYAANSAGSSWAAPSQSFTTLAANPSATRIPVTTYHYDNTRQAVNPNETLLTLANVNTNTFGKLFSYTVDGYVYSEPLILTNLTIPGQGVHDVVFIATEHDTVYAFDADSNAGANGGLLWKLNLGTSALSSSGTFGYRYTHAGYPDIVPEVGATGTPVIDPATGTLYVDAFTVESGNYIHRIHALDVTTGNERSYSPVVVAGSVPGTGVGSVGGVMTFSAIQHNQRPALTLAGGRLYVGYAGYADTDPYHGWLFGYNATNLVLQTNYMFNSTPNASTAAFGVNAAEGGIWQGGGGLVADTNNNLYFETGNGSFSQNTNGGDYADSFLKLSTTNGLAIADYFTPYNQASLQSADLDLGACGPLLLPDSVGSTNHPHLLVGSGKNGTIYLLDRDNLGHYNGTDGVNGNDSQIVQSVTGQIGYIWSPPAYFNNLLFFQSSSSVMRSFAVASGALSTGPVSSGNVSVGAYNGGPVVSANGTNNAIVWCLNSAAFASSGPGVLFALNATNLSQTLYTSSQLATRDNPGGAVKLTTPTVAGGKVYVPAQYTLSVYGVQVFLDTPIISPNGGTFINQATITLSDASPGTSIYYTLDGTTPTAVSYLYSGPFILTSNALVQAIAIQPGAVNSAVASASFINTARLGDGTGLLGRYWTNTTSVAFTNVTFNTPATLTRTDAVVNFNWSAAGPDPTIGQTNYTVRWIGAVQPQFSELYTLTTMADDGVRLYVNGQLLINDWTDKTGTTTNSVSLAFTAQQLYNVELDYYQKTSNATVSLSWSSPSTPAGIIPQTQLYAYTNPPPTVILTGPAGSATNFTAAASVTLAAQADAPYNPISSVAFYANGSLLGTLSNSPDAPLYTFTTTGLAAGNYVLTAVATDGSGLSSTSAPVNITIKTASGQPYGLTSNGTVPAFLNMPVTSAGSLPPLLSETGAFSNTTNRVAAGGLIPYVPNTPLWSDAAVKSRYLALPNTGGALTPEQQISFLPTNSWTFPAGTVFVKNFDLVVNETNPAVPLRRLETRLLVRDINGQVYGVTYKWRPDNSDADLLASSLNEAILITNATGIRTQTWYYPSPSDCLTCHTPVAGYVLGISTRQLNGNETYPATGVTDNQLRTFNRLGLFNPAFDEAGITNFAKMSALTNLTASLENRSRSYLDANCAQCHQPGGTGITFDARYDTPLAQQHITNYPAALNLGYDNACIVKAQDVWRSMIWQRINTTNTAIQMPTLARNLIDTNAVQVFTDWINSLPGTPALAPPVISPNGGSYVASVKVSVQAPTNNVLIYYTLDGSLPTTNSLLYTGPFNLLNSATVSASAFATNYNNSVAASALFLVQPLYFTSAGFLPNQSFQLGFMGTAGSNYVLQASTNLINWTPVSTNLALTNLFNLVDPAATNFPCRFYRVLQQ